MEAHDVRERAPRTGQAIAPLHLEQVVGRREPYEQEGIGAVNICLRDRRDRRRIRDRWRRIGRSRVQQDEPIETEWTETARLRAIIEEFEFTVRWSDEGVVAHDIRKRAPWTGQTITPLHLEQVVGWRK